LPKRTNAGNPGDWLDFADADLSAVRLLVEQQIAFNVCRSKLAESLEKLLKADLIRHGWTLRKIHDLQTLLDDLAGFDAEQVSQIQPLVDELAEAYTQTRYPGFDLADDNWPRLQELLLQVQKYRQQVANTLNTVH